MSDGNFNRSMLPSNSYQSGVRAGKAQMQALALQSLEDVLQQHADALSETTRATLLTDFKERLLHQH